MGKGACCISSRTWVQTPTTHMKAGHGWVFFLSKSSHGPAGQMVSSSFSEKLCLTVKLKIRWKDNRGRTLMAFHWPPCVSTEAGTPVHIGTHMLALYTNALLPQREEISKKLW